jgi:putative endonuclease
MLDERTQMSHWIYILKCIDKTLYTGYAVDVDKRCAKHNSGKGGAKYTRCRLPVEVVYREEYDTKSDALKREYQIKQMSRLEKLKLIKCPIYFSNCQEQKQRK